MLASRTVAQALQALLVAAGTAAGSRWYLGRAWPLATLPAGKVVLSDEDLDAAEDMALNWPRYRQHTLQVDVQCFADDATDPEAAADALAEEVLQALEGTAQPIDDVDIAATTLRRQLQTDGQARVAVTTVQLRLIFGGRSDDPSLIT